MARIIRLALDVYPPTEFTGQHCVEIFQWIRTAGPNRVAHFGFEPAIEANDVSWCLDIFGNIFTSLVSSTIGLAQPLDF